MRVYQSKEKTVKDYIRILDADVLISKAGEGLLSLSVDLGLEVLRQLMEDEVTVYAGPKGKHQKDRDVYRHGSGQTKVVLGGRKVQTARPRMRQTKYGESAEMPLETLTLFQNEDPLNKAMLFRLLSGVSTRKYSRTIDTGDADSACTSKSEVSRRFAAAMKTVMDDFFGRRIEGSYPAIMIAGMGFGKMTIIAVLGIAADGTKRMLGLAEGGSENSVVVKALLCDLISRGLDTEEPRLYVIDGGKALHKAITDTFGKRAVIQRCQVHKKRNVLDCLPKSEKNHISMSLTAAYREYDYDKALTSLTKVAKLLDFKYPKAAESLREGLGETLTVNKLKVPGVLRQTLSNTNAIESANSTCAGVIRRVTNHGNGASTIRHAAAGFMEAERGFRRVRGYRELPLLQNALAQVAQADKKELSELTGFSESVRMGVA